LKKWKSKKGHEATYGKLLEVCVKKRSFICAEKILTLLGASGMYSTS
jgi:hypothetical protein